MCAERVLGEKEWALDRAIQPWHAGFHSSPPEYEIGDEKVYESPATFHQIRPKDFEKMARAHILEYSIDDHVNISVDLGLYSFTRHRIRLGSEGNVFEWRFGFWIALEEARIGFIKSIERWKAILNDQRELIGFSQRYENEIEITCECDASITTQRAYFSHFLDPIGSKPLMRISCENLTYVRRVLEEINETSLASSSAGKGRST
jgi:hypothetical protein